MCERACMHACVCVCVVSVAYLIQCMHGICSSSQHWTIIFITSAICLIRFPSFVVEVVLKVTFEPNVSDSEVCLPL